jgi:hypothetical protein
MDDLAVPPTQILASLTRVLGASELLFQELDVLEGLLLCLDQLSPGILCLDLSLGIGDHLEVRLVGSRSPIEVMFPVAAILVGVIEFSVLLIEMLRRDVIGSLDEAVRGIDALSRPNPCKSRQRLADGVDIPAEYLKRPFGIPHALLNPLAAVIDL